MEFESKMSISTKILENYRENEIIEEQRLLDLAKTFGLKEGIGIHTRQIERLNLATNEELFRWFIREASERYQ